MLLVLIVVTVCSRDVDFTDFSNLSRFKRSLRSVDFISQFSSIKYDSHCLFLSRVIIIVQFRNTYELTNCYANCVCVVINV